MYFLKRSIGYIVKVFSSLYFSFFTKLCNNKCGKGENYEENFVLYEGWLYWILKLISAIQLKFLDPSKIHRTRGPDSSRENRLTFHFWGDLLLVANCVGSKAKNQRNKALGPFGAKATSGGHLLYLLPFIWAKHN